MDAFQINRRFVSDGREKASAFECLSFLAVLSLRFNEMISDYSSINIHLSLFTSLAKGRPRSDVDSYTACFFPIADRVRNLCDELAIDQTKDKSSPLHLVEITTDCRQNFHCVNSRTFCDENLLPTTDIN